MSDHVPPLSAELQHLVDEEEALLARTLAAIKASNRRAVAVPRLAEELSLLKEEAATANVADLPHLFNQLDLVSAVVDRTSTQAFTNVQSPYFAHLRLNGPVGPRDYLLGRGSFTDASADVRIIDWRTAPLARVFYNYQEGDDYEETFGDRLSHGDVLIRRLVIIERGVLKGIRRGHLSLERLDDGTWVESSARPGFILGGGAGTAVRSGSLARFDITAQLDAAQYTAMSVPADEPLLVLGSAGSGKTTVALHRLGRLAAKELSQVARNRMQVIVPEEGLARLSRRLLAPLGLEKVPVKTLSDWARDTARKAFKEPDLEAFHDAPPLVTRLKRHPALAAAITTHPALKHRPAKLAALRAQLAEVFTDRTFLESVVAGSSGDLPRTAIEETVHHTMLQMASSFSPEDFDSEATTTIDGKSVTEGTPDALAGTIDVEDLPVLMSLRAESEALDIESLAHVVLDEAEDFSMFELDVVGRLLSEERSCTIAGDEMQQTTSSFPGWPSVLKTLGVPDAEQCRLKVSYRCPQPIAALARDVLGDQAAGLETTTPTDAREALPVGFHHFPNYDQAALFLRDAIQDLTDREPRASVAVIASSADQADRFFAGLSGLRGVRRVTEGQYTFEPGVDVTDADEVKGLEWDYVVLPDVTARAYPVDAEARRRLHVSITRAAHQLWVLSYDLRSRLLSR